MTEEVNEPTEEAQTEEVNEPTEEAQSEAPKRAGRRVTLTPEIIETICAAVSIGTPNKYAAVYAGVPERTFYQWVTWGEEEQKRLAKDPKAKPDRKRKIFLQLLQSIEEARGNRVVTWTDVVNRAAQVDPKWAMEMLARTEPEHFSPQTIMTHRVEKELEKALDVLEQGLDADTYAKVIGLLAGETGGTALAEDTPGPAADAES